MLNYCIKNKRGVITVFFSIILIVMMSFGSLMVEFGRARSVNTIVSQITESAAFSTLSNYDRDLYKRFALMALSPNIDEATFENYVKACLNEDIDNPKLLEKNIKLNAVEVVSMYPLANPDVIRAQIEENWKYRGPYNVVDGTLNLEASISEYIKNLEKASTIISFFKTIATMANDVAGCVESIVQYSEDYNDYEAKDTAYKDGVDTYNEAVETYENDIASLDPKSDTYADDKKAIEDTMQAAGDTFKDQIQDLIDSTNTMANSMDNMIASITALLADGVTLKIQDVCRKEIEKMEGSHSSEYSNWTAEEKTRYKGFLSTMADPDAKDQFSPLLQDLKNGADKLKKVNYADFTKDLEAQRDRIKPTWSKESAVKVEIGFILGVELLFNIFYFFFNIAQKIINLFKAFFEAIKTFLDVIKGLSALLNWPMMDFLQCGSISGVKDALPSSHPDTGQLQIVTDDKTMVTDKVNETNDIANKVGYDNRYVNPSIDNSTIALSDKAKALMDNITDYKDATGRIGDALTSFNILKFVVAIVDALTAGIRVLGSLISIMGEIMKLTATKVMQTIYSKLMIADYAVSQFPNRTSNLVSGKDGLGNKWSSYSSYWSQTNDFGKARAEYIFAGGDSELGNQFMTFMVMYLVRGLSNILPLFLNKMIQDLTKDTMEFFPFNLILVVIVMIIFWIMETLMDMILLTWGKVKLPLVKLDLWCFSKEGSEKLLKKLQSILTSNAFKNSTLVSSVFPQNSTPQSSSTNGTNGKTYLADTAGKFTDNFEIGYWGYTDYLRIMIAFKPQEGVVMRMADLIQLEMSKIKGTEYKMQDANTYIRTKTDVSYNPLLPILSIPNANNKIFNLQRVYYAGY